MSQESKKKTPKSRKLVLLADAAIYQTMVLDQEGRPQNYVIYHCGETMFYAHSIFALFAEGRARPVPKWLREQIPTCPDRRHLNVAGTHFLDGTPYTEGMSISLDDPEDIVDEVSEARAL